MPKGVGYLILSNSSSPTAFIAVDLAPSTTSIAGNVIGFSTCPVAHQTFLWLPILIKYSAIVTTVIVTSGRSLDHAFALTWTTGKT